MSAVPENVPAPLKLDLGCGSGKQAGFIGVDVMALDGVDLVFDLRETPWPWENDSVEEVHCSHFLEHLTNLNGKWERVRFFNELYRVMKKGAKCTLTFPHWASNRYYGDPTHCEPFSEMGFWYLDPKWREGNAKHADKRWNPNGYDCDFDCTWGYALHQSLAVRNSEYQQHALTFWKEAAQDIVATMKKR